MAQKIVNIRTLLAEARQKVQDMECTCDWSENIDVVAGDCDFECIVEVSVTREHDREWNCHYYDAELISLHVVQDDLVILDLTLLLNLKF